MFAIDFDIGNIVLEDSGNVHLQTPDKLLKCVTKSQRPKRVVLSLQPRGVHAEPFNRCEWEKERPYLRKGTL